MKRLLVFLMVWSLYPLCAQESYMARADRFSSDSLGDLIRNQSVSVQWRITALYSRWHLYLF